MYSFLLLNNVIKIIKCVCGLIVKLTIFYLQFRTEFNRMMTKPTSRFYLGMTMVIDISVYITIYGYHLLVRILCGCIARVVFILTYIIVFTLSALINKAHWSYQLTSSLIATKTILLRHKFNVNLFHIQFVNCLIF